MQRQRRQYVHFFFFFLYCRTALVDLGLNDVDPGLAPEGARCDEDSLCVNRKCMPVASLTIGPASCPGNNCNGHGMCNSKGHCHCDIGYAPPYCDVTGPGGSLDSGPASDAESSSSKWYFSISRNFFFNFTENKNVFTISRIFFSISGSYYYILCSC